MKTGSAAFRFDLASSMCCFFRRYHALTLHIRAAPTVQDAAHTCRRRGMNVGVNTTCQKSVITARLSTTS